MQNTLSNMLQFKTKRFLRFYLKLKDILILNFNFKKQNLYQRYFLSDLKREKKKRNLWIVIYICIYLL